MSEIQALIAKLHDKSDFSILFAEDEPMIRKPMSMIIERICSDVVVACDGAQAWEAYQKRDFSLVITDLEMPYMSGSELIAHIKEKKPSQKIAVVTAYRDGAEIEEVKKQNIDCIIDKPLSLPIFISVIQSVIDQIP